MRHIALAIPRQPICHLNYTRSFKHENVDVVMALKHMAKLPDSRWRTVESATGFGTLPKLVEKLLEMRRVENTLGKKWYAVE